MLKAGIRRQTIANKFVPVVGGSAFKNKGVQYLVDAVIDYLPSPLDIPPAKGMEPGHARADGSADGRQRQILLARLQALERSVRRQARLLPRLFRHADARATPFTIRARTSASASRRLIQIQADKREDIDTCYSGDIAAIVGIKNITTGDTLCDEDYPILLEPPSFPDPVISMAIEPKTKLDQEKMGDRAAASRPKKIRLSASSPTKTPARRSSPAWASCTSKSSATACSANSRSTRTRASRRSLIAKRSPTPADGEGKLIKQSGGRGQYGHVDRQGSPERARQGHHGREQGRRRQHSEGIHPGLSRRASKKRCSTASSAAIQVIDVECRHRRRHPTTTSTRTKWRSRWRRSSR